jgi:hypothetical protein
MNSSPRFVSLLWEASAHALHVSLSLRLHVPAQTPPHPQNSLTHYTKSTWSSLPRFQDDSQWSSVVQFLVRSLTVLFTINHVKLLSSSVGGSTFFYPHLVYEFTRTFGVSLSQVQDFPLSEGLPSSISRSLSLPLSCFPGKSLRYRGRSPLLSVSRLIG